MFIPSKKQWSVCR